MTQQAITTQSEQDTKDFAQKCADEAVVGDIFLLQGPMGAGKSVFARQFIQTFAKEDINVPSPTFTLLQAYDFNQASIWHFDLYRLEDEEEIYELGWEEALINKIVLVEWPERLGALKPASYKEIIIKPINAESRKVTVNHVKEGHHAK